MTRIALTAALLGFSVCPVAANPDYPLVPQPWGLVAMNEEIEQTNFIIADNCSATLISVEHRLLLTNRHCIAGYIRTDDSGVETRIDVPVSQKLYRGHRDAGRINWIADLVAYDESVDLALLQVVADLPHHTIAARIFTGERVWRGEPVWAVGNPMGLDLSVTRGIISSTNRTITVTGADVRYYQMDVTIAGGSSGGSLYNDQGYLIGVPAVVSANAPIGLAIPYTDVQAFLTANCYAEVYDPDSPTFDECAAVAVEVAT